MIVGMSEFKFEISKTELSKHLGERVSHHNERVKFYTDKVTSLRETAEKYVAAEDGKGVTLPEEILEQITVEPNYSGLGGLGNWQDMQPVAGARGMRAMALGVKRAAVNAQDQIKQQVLTQLDRLTQQHEAGAKGHQALVEEFSFYLAHLPAKTCFELAFADLRRFELIRGSFSGYGLGQMYSPAQVVSDVEAFG